MAVVIRNENFIYFDVYWREEVTPCHSIGPHLTIIPSESRHTGQAGRPETEGCGDEGGEGLQVALAERHQAADHAGQDGERKRPDAGERGTAGGEETEAGLQRSEE